MKQPVLLIQPLTNIFDKGKTLPTLPLSLLSAVRNVAVDHPIRIVDLRRDDQWRKTIKRHLDEKPVCAGVTSITGNQIFSALEAVRFVRSHSTVPIVWGGIHGTLFPDQVLEEPAVDFVVRGEGEETFADLVRALTESRDPDTLAGISFRKNGNPHHNPARPFIDLETAREVPYAALPGSPCFHTQGRPTLYLETSRGCFSRCAYCYNAFYHQRQWRAQSAETILDRINKTWGLYPEIRHLSFVDDNYFGNMDRVRRIAEGLVESHRPVTYQIQGAHIQVVSGMGEADLRLLHRSGCIRLDMGVESGSAKILASMHKPMDLEKIASLNRRLSSIGITPWFNFMVGFPDETREDFDATRRFMLRLLDDNPKALVSPMYRVVPYPGTDLWNTARERGFVPPANLEGWRGFHTGEIRIPWQSAERIQEMKRLYFLSIFADSKLSVYDTHPLYKFLARIYRPVARYRLRKNFLSFMPEFHLFNRLFDVS